MDFPISQLTSLIPVELDLISTLKFIAMIAAAGLVISILGRLVFGKHSALNHAVSSSMGIVFVYVATVVIYTFNPQGLSRFLAPLPFVGFSGDYLYLFNFRLAAFPDLCSEVLSLILLAFLVNCIDSIIPKGKTKIRWFILRFLSVVLSIWLHYGITWVLETYLPGVLVTYAPILLLTVLLVSVMIGFLNIVLSLVMVLMNPIFGILYTFFFSNIFGKQISKAILSAALVTALLFVLEAFGYGIICISATALLSYLPLLIALLALWYLIGHLL